MSKPYYNVRRRPWSRIEESLVRVFEVVKYVPGDGKFAGVEQVVFSHRDQKKAEAQAQKLNMNEREQA